MVQSKCPGRVSWKFQKTYTDTALSPIALAIASRSAQYARGILA